MEATRRASAFTGQNWPGGTAGEGTIIGDDAMLSAEQNVFDPKWNCPSLFGGLRILSHSKEKEKGHNDHVCGGTSSKMGPWVDRHCAAAALMVSTGSANIGFGAGSRSFMLFSTYI
eukprot:scaffold65439_cov46-Attheya_sp.AAC.1